MYKRCIVSGLLFVILFASGDKVSAAPLIHSPQMKMETVLTDKVYNQIYSHIYKPKRKESEKQNGEEIAEFACRYIGNPYVWGGTSLTEGADCSGFVQAIYKEFGISLPRTSLAQRKAGIEINYEQAAPGDLICYEGHVGIYIGNGKIVNARNYKEGIGITSANYTKILTVRRVI